MSYALSIPYTEYPRLAGIHAHPGKTHYPMIKTVLQYERTFANFSFNSIVDSGAENCIFPAGFGAQIGIDIRKGLAAASVGIGGADYIYYHNIKVWVIIENQPWHFDCRAGFSTSLDKVGWGLLGRLNFFDLFQEVIFDQKRHLLRLKADGTRPKKKKDLGPLANFIA